MYNQYIKQERNTKRALYGLGLAVGLLVMYFVILSPLLMIIFGVYGLFFFGAYSITEKTRKKHKVYDWSEDTFICVGKTSFNYLLTLVFPLVVPYTLLMFMLLEMFENKVHSVWLVAILIISIAILLGITLHIRFKNSTLIYKEGIKSMSQYFPFDDLKKHQFISYRKGGYLLQIRFDKRLLSFIVKDEEYHTWSQLLEDKTTQIT